jgi:hypothetical protein
LSALTILAALPVPSGHTWQPWLPPRLLKVTDAARLRLGVELSPSMAKQRVLFPGTTGTTGTSLNKCYFQSQTHPPAAKKTRPCSFYAPLPWRKFVPVSWEQSRNGVVVCADACMLDKHFMHLGNHSRLFLDPFSAYSIPGIYLLCCGTNYDTLCIYATCSLAERTHKGKVNSREAV